MILNKLSPLVLKSKFDITNEDLSFLSVFGKKSAEKMEIFFRDFYKWLPSLDEYAEVFTDSQKIQVIKNSQNVYWHSLFCSQVDQDYIDVRHQTGMTYARIGLSINTFCASVNFSINWWNTCIKELIKDKDLAHATSKAFQKLCMLDTALISDVYSNDLFCKVSEVSEETYNILERATTAIEHIAVGEVSFEYQYRSEREERLGNAFKRLNENLRSIIKQAKSIARGNFATELQVLGPNDELGASLVEMTKMLREIDSINKTSNWIKTGQAELSNIMKGDQDVYSLSKKTISYLCKYLGALIGTIYLVVEEDGLKMLKIVATYAYDRRRANGLDIAFGEGLIGQSALEKEIIIFSDVPDDYININSSVGEVTPKHLAIIPVMVDNEVYGVLELGSHKLFSEPHIEFIKQVSNNIALSIKITQDHERIKKLLEESNAQTLKLRAQQEKLRLSNDELEAQQRKLQNSNQELECKAEELRKSEESVKKKNRELQEISERLQIQKEEIEQKNKAIESSQKELEIKAKELEISSKYKSEFLANMSHELRTPLNSLLILSENLAKNEDSNLNAEQVESAQIIHSGGKDLLALINDILDLSKVEAGKLTITKEQVNLQMLLGRLKRQFEVVAKKKLLTFSYYIDEELPETIVTDGQRVEQIIKNFLSNAFKFTEQGEVKLTFSMPLKNPLFKTNQIALNNCLAISVEDSGIGIAKDKQYLIFEAFHQIEGSSNRRFNGTGLGLSIAKQLAGLLGCEIQVHSEEGVGSKFTLFVPYNFFLDKEENSAKKNNNLAFHNDKESLVKKNMLIVDDTHSTTFKQKDYCNWQDRVELLAGRKVLLVDDDMRNTYALSAVLRKKGLNVAMADNGKLALEKLEKEANFDIVIMDIMMPIMDGYEAMREIRNSNKYSKIPIIALTAKVLPEDRIKAMECGASDFLTKPVEMDKLIELMGIWTSSSV